LSTVNPRRPLLIALTCCAALALAAAIWPALLLGWRVLGLALAGLAIADAWLLLRTPTPRVQRRVAGVLPQGVWNDVRLELSNPTGHVLRLDLHDMHPADGDTEGLPLTLRLGPRARRACTYRLRLSHRGTHRFAGCDLRLHSPAGLWSRRRRADAAETVDVYPNFREISHYTLLAASDSLSDIGVRRRRRRGTGAEFHQLREYRRGDSLRQIDWKATSRMRKPIAREYQDERDQRLLFLLDSGRRMRHLGRNGHAHLDDALNAVLLLAYVAVRQGDAVGLMAYGGERRWFAPRKDPDTVNRLLRAVFDVQPSLHAADPLAAAQDLLRRQPRRALVVLVTNGRDEDHPELMRAVQVLRRRHLVVVADLREAALDEALEAPIRPRTTRCDSTPSMATWHTGAATTNACSTSAPGSWTCARTSSPSRW
jgi:uncharacterized protein (DUF58 family)